MLSAGGGFRERWISAQDGLRLYLRDYGDPLTVATPVVCLSGLTRNSKDYHTLAGGLASRRRVVCPDYRGRGRSDYDRDWRNYRPDVYVRDLMQIFAALNLHKAVICGTSLGGLLAMALAAAAPTLLAGAILNDIGPDVDPKGLARILRYIGENRPQADWKAATDHVKTLYSHLNLEGEAEWRHHAEATFREGGDGLLHYDWDVALARPLAKNRGQDIDLWRLYGAVKRIPVLAIRGGRSDILSEQTFARMAQHKPDLIQLTVPDAGHTPPLDHGPAATAIATFLADLDVEPDKEARFRP